MGDMRDCISHKYLERKAMPNELLDKALYYTTELGWYVFPTRDVESEKFWSDDEQDWIVRKPKSPYIAGGFTVATQDEQQIREWWTKYPRAGIGVACGKSGLVCVDIDIKDDANGNPRHGFRNYMSLGISDAGTFQAITPSGGLHIIYTGKLNSFANIKSGVDIRSKGAYFVAPPSVIYDRETDTEIGKYIAVGDWIGKPVSVPDNMEEKLNELRGITTNATSYPSNRERYNSESLDSLRKRLEEALPRVPSYVCDDYFTWVNVGLALKNSLGDAGFDLWDNWSKQSSKYPKGGIRAMQRKWNSFKPSQIGAGTIFFYAKQGDGNA